MATAASAGGWFLRGREALARHDASTAALSAQVQEVERELRDLRWERELTRTAAAAKVDPAQPSKPAEPNKAKEKGTDHLTDAQRNELVSARLDQQFDTDGVDPSWSDHTEREISNAVIESLPKSKLEDVRCRSSICRMAFTHQNAEAAEDFIGTLSHMRAFASEAVIRNVGTPEQPRSVVYLARPGHRLDMPAD
jgi:hypothetical protein